MNKQPTFSAKHTARIGIFILLTILMISCNNSDSSAGKPELQLLTETEVHDFIKNYDMAFSNRDTLAMKEMMDEHYTYFTSTGSTITKSESIAVFTPAGKYKVDTVYRNEIKIKLNGNTAIVSSHWVGNGTYDNEAFNDNQRCGLVIQKLDNKIRIISEHCTQIAK